MRRNKIVKVSLSEPEHEKLVAAALMAGVSQYLSVKKLGVIFTHNVSKISAISPVPV